jgi:hydrophobic/amphiphilic exporter-1 (mainly G- bacteria), HAE1 family
MKRLIQFAVDYPITILMGVLAVLLLGVISYGKLGVDLFPDLNNPRIFIEISAGERPPEEMEKQFVEGIEALAIRQSDVMQVSSISQVGSAQVTVEYTWSKNMDEAFLNLQKDLNTFSQNRDIDEINLTQHNPNSAPIMLLGISHQELTDMNELRKVSETYIRNKLVRLEGVADVKLSGEEEGEVIISTNHYKLEAFNLSLDEISQRIQNFNRNVSGGNISEMGMRYVIKGVSMVNEVQDLENIIVGYKPIEAVTGAANRAHVSSAPIFLREVADVSYSNKEPLNIVRIDGKRCIGLSVYKENRFNTVNAIDNINTSIAEIEKALPGYKLSVISNQGSFIQSAINEVKNTALIGILLAVFVLFIFLRRFGTTFIVSIAIPISLIATFNMMYFGDLTINIMTLGGLALGAGMLVDNAIVVLENMFRNHENGMSAREAAITGTSQVGGAIVASTLTTIVVFLPIVYLHGASGELFKDQAWTVTFSLLSSLLVAVFLIPMLYYRFYRKETLAVTKKSLSFTSYGSFLERVLKFKWGVIIISAVLVGLSFLMLPFIGTEFMPQSGTREFDIQIQLQEGTQLDRTSSAIANLESMVSEVLRDEYQTIYSHTGILSGISSSSQAVFQGENTGFIKVVMKEESPFSSRDAIEAINQVVGDIPGLEITYTESETALKSILGTDEAPMIVEVKGEDLEVIEELTLQVKERISNISGLYNVKSSIEGGSPELEVVVDRLRAGLYNLNVSTIIGQIQDQLQGKEAGEMEKGGELIGINLKLPDQNISTLQNLVIISGNEKIRLDEVADITTAVAPKEIYRRNQNRIGRVMAQMEKGVVLDHVAKEINQALSPIVLPGNYSISLTGEEEKRQESMQSLRFALLLSLVLVYMVLASQFESLIHPFTILLSIPLAGFGTVLLFFILGKTFSIMAIIGVIMLAGIAVNNAIILVDRINQMRMEGYSRHEAIILAAQQRIRPIIMTSITTILALIPLSFGFGESASLRSPMALAVIGGLFTSTLLTLIVIPCFYLVLDPVRDIFSGKKRGSENHSAI